MYPWQVLCPLNELRLLPSALDLTGMDPITAVGLVASILQLVAAVKSVIDLGRDAANAAQDQRVLLLEVENLVPLLEDLKSRLHQPNNQSVNGIQKLEKPLSQLKETMEHIDRKLGSANKIGSRPLIWAFWNKTEADADLAKIERFKAVLNAWLLLDNWDVGQQQEKNYNQIRQDQYQMTKTITSSSNAQRQDNYRILTEVRNVAQDQHQFLNSAERDKIIEWLSPLNFFARHDDIFRTRQEGTGRWFLEDSRFKNWLLSTGESVWCLGIRQQYWSCCCVPESQRERSPISVQYSGRSVVGLPPVAVVTVPRHPWHGYPSRAVEDFSLRKTARKTRPSRPWNGFSVPTLTVPLVSAFEASRVLNMPLNENRRTRPSLDEVREIFRSTVAEYSRVFVVVDALDEYPEAHRHILLDALAAIGESVSLMLTSRPNIAPKSFFPTAPVLEICAKEEDICRYIDAQIQNSFRLSKHVRVRPELREEIETKIAENTNGMFLIAKLHIDSLATKSTVKAVRDALQNLPEDLEHTYDEAMPDRIEAQNKDDTDIARRTLIWVANTKRPLTVFELQEALAIDPDSRAFDADGLLDVEIILSVCVGLVIVEASQWFGLDPRYSIVRLVHLTIQEYLERVRPTRFPEAQTEITRNCLVYIAYKNVRERLYYWEHGLLSYAVPYCLLHAAGEPELLLQDIIIQFLGDARCYRLYMGPPQWNTTWPRESSKIWVAALFGLQEITSHLLDSDKAIDEEEKEGALKVALEWNCLDVIRVLIKHGTNGNVQRLFIGDILRAASQEGHTKAVRLLLENGADVNLQGRHYETALHAALAEWHLEIVQLLLKHGANVDLQGGQYGTALQRASAKGGKGLVQLLLKHSADVNLQGGQYGTALQAALWQGSIEVVQMLLEHGADVNKQGGYYGTALQAASAEGEEGVVRLLLNHGASVNLQGGYYGTALQAASAEGAEGVVRLLLMLGADVNVQGGYFGTALQAASWSKSVEVVQLLLEHGADVNAQGGEYGTALQTASWRGCTKVMQMLLEHGADVNAQGGDYGTALHAASAKEHLEIVQLLLKYEDDGTALQAASVQGHLQIVQLLLEHGTDVNAQNEYGTALQAASAQGHLQVVQLLLEHGADVNAQNEYGTALQAASVQGHTGVVQLLLKHGANINLQGGYYGTSLQAASVQGHLRVVQLLLEHGADVNLQGGGYGTCLKAASAEGRKGVVQLLLKHGANINLQGGFYGTALQAASWLDNMEVVQLLLENGADVNAQGGEYGTALQAALCYGCLETVLLLLEHRADVNLQGGKYGTTLQAASTWWEQGVVRLLLMHGAAVDMQGGKYGTALQAASAKRRPRVVQLLLKHGADVNTQGGKYGTAYRAAKLNKHAEVVDLLLVHGADTDLTAESEND
ncbi:ankyrin repeat-containing domain protein [Mycena rebaudengoi]|nr:ankyrin repeat-containing domain protein [Mycena rebaudengoi]